MDIISTENKCPFCESTLENSSPRGLVYDVNCIVCGHYFIDVQAARRIADNQEYKDKRYILSGKTREASDNGCPREITVNNIQDIFDSTSVPDGPFEKIDRILQYIYYQADTDLAFVKIESPEDYPISYARDWKEFSRYLNKAIDLVSRQRCKV